MSNKNQASKAHSSLTYRMMRQWYLQHAIKLSSFFLGSPPVQLRSILHNTSRWASTFNMQRICKPSQATKSMNTHPKCTELMANKNVSISKFLGYDVIKYRNEKNKFVFTNKFFKDERNFHPKAEKFKKIHYLKIFCPVNTHKFVIVAFMHRVKTTKHLNDLLLIPDKRQNLHIIGDGSQKNDRVDKFFYCRAIVKRNENISEGS